MKVIRGLEDLVKEKFSKTCLTLGKFDGVHLGHQQIINDVVSSAAKSNAKSVVITFHPLPDKKKTITNLEQKLDLFKELKIDYTVVINPTGEFMKITAEEFIHSFLIEKFNVDTIITGYNFHFGYQKKGNTKLLEEFAAKGLFKYSVVENISSNHQGISSSMIRKFLSLGRLDSANEMLGRKFSMQGALRILKDGVRFDFNSDYTDVLSGAYLISLNVNDMIIYAVGLFENEDGGVGCYLLDTELKLTDVEDIEINLLTFMRPARVFAKHEDLAYQIGQDIKAANYLVKNLFD